MTQTVARARHGALSGSLALVVATSACLPVHAQSVESFYKGKTIRIIVGFTSGGGYDQYGRLLARYMGKYIPGTPNIVVQNMPGAASLKSVQYLGTGAPADGTTITTFNAGLLTASLMTPKKVPVKLLDYAWIGNVSEDFRVCFTWNKTGIKTWQDFISRPKVTFGNTGIGTSAYVDDRILSELFGVKIHMVQGYPGSADKRLAIERGELDGDCGSWTSLPDDWIRDKKITLLTRFSKDLAPGMPKDLPYAGDLLNDTHKKQVLSFLTAAALMGRPFIAPKATPNDRVAALQAAFDKTMTDKDFLAEAQKEGLTITPMSGPATEKAIAALYTSPPDVISDARKIAEE